MIYTIDPPQNLQLGRYHVNQSALPYISIDVWYELADNKQIFFVRDEPPVDYKLWLDNLSWPVILITNNNGDHPWPPMSGTVESDPSGSNATTALPPRLLDHPNLKRFYTMNPIVEHPKVRPLPIGPKWQYTSRELFGEPKRPILERLSAVSSNPEHTKRLFSLDNRTNSVWIRPSKNHREHLYPITNKALRTPRKKLCKLLRVPANHSAVCDTDMLSPAEYFQRLQRHRFVLSPTGHGLDSHATWEALLAGCIPIVPHSTLDPMFENLPVWLVNNWADEVTDTSVERKAREFLSKRDTYHWDKVFATGWVREMERDLAGVVNRI
jgi:hypothetical protein